VTQTPPRHLTSGRSGSAGHTQPLSACTSRELAAIAIESHPTNITLHNAKSMGQMPVNVATR